MVKTLSTSRIIDDDPPDLRPAWEALSWFEEIDCSDEAFLLLEDAVNDIATAAGPGEQIHLKWDGSRLTATCKGEETLLWPRPRVQRPRGSEGCPSGGLPDAPGNDPGWGYAMTDAELIARVGAVEFRWAKPGQTWPGFAIPLQRGGVWQGDGVKHTHRNDLGLYCAAIEARWLAKTSGATLVEGPLWERASR